ncbi:hypothetical protein PanWU01x14_031080, partial [Parasponia andersonii]
RNNHFKGCIHMIISCETSFKNYTTNTITVVSWVAHAQSMCKLKRMAARRNSCRNEGKIILIHALNHLLTNYILVQHKLSFKTTKRSKHLTNYHIISLGPKKHHFSLSV